MQAAEILTKLSTKEGSIKSLTLADNVKEKKKMYALICETLKCMYDFFNLSVFTYI
jgi:putative methyltransferase